MRARDARLVVAGALCGLALAALPVLALQGAIAAPRALVALRAAPSPSASPIPAVCLHQIDVTAVARCPVLQLTPAVGPRGTVVTAVGTGFAAGLAVELAWDQGQLSPGASPVQSDRLGSFTVTLLIFPNDPLGPRSLGATVSDGGQAFLLASAPFTVLPGSAEPGDFAWRR